MRSKLAILAAGAALAVTGLEAKANFILNYTRSQIASGPNAGNDFITVRAFNDGVGGTGTKLLGTGITLDASSPIVPGADHFIFRLAHLDADNALDADVNMNPNTTIVNYADGVTPSRTTQPFSQNPISPNTGTAIRPRGTGESFANWNAQLFIPASPFSNPVVVTDVDGNVVSATPSTNPTDRYNNTNVKSFRVEGVYLGPDFSPLANTGTPATGGATFAIVVVPHDATVTVSGSLAGDIGQAQTIVPLVIPAPEPGSLALLGVGAAAFLGRRRRKA